MFPPLSPEPFRFASSCVFAAACRLTPYGLTRARTRRYFFCLLVPPRTTRLVPLLGRSHQRQSSKSSTSSARWRRSAPGATKTVIYGAVKSAENLISFLGQRALGIGKNALEGVEKHISKAVAASLLIGLSSAALELSGALPHSWAWLRPLLEALSNRPRAGLTPGRRSPIIHLSSHLRRLSGRSRRLSLPQPTLPLQGGLTVPPPQPSPSSRATSPHRPTQSFTPGLAPYSRPEGREEIRGRGTPHPEEPAQRASRRMRARTAGVSWFETRSSLRSSP